MKTPILETPRLILRPITLEDAPSIQKHFNNWNIIKNLAAAVPWPYPDDGAYTHIYNDLLPEIKAGNSHAWVIVIKTQGLDAVGIIHFRFQDKKKQGNRGFWIAEKYHGQGLMTEAISAVNDFVFDELKIDSFTVMNAFSNVASRRVKEKTGAIYVGLQDSPHHNGDKQSEVWEVTKESWRHQKKKRTE